MQPNTSRALTFAQSFISSGGIEALLFLLQREAKTGNDNVTETPILNNIEILLNDDSGLTTISKECEGLDEQVELSELEERASHEEECERDPLTTYNARNRGSEVETSKSEDRAVKDQLESPEQREPGSHNRSPESEPEPEPSISGNNSTNVSLRTNIERLTSISDNQLLKSLGGITFSINADSARNNVYNIDSGDGIVVGIIKLLGALVTSGHLQFSLNSASSTVPSKTVNSGLAEDDIPMSGDKVSLLLFALQKALEAAPNRLMTANVYMALLGATVGSRFAYL